MSDNSLIKFGGNLTKPATVLIEKVSDAVGGIFKPYQMVRVAKAVAEVERIREESKIEVSDISRRAMNRFFVEEAKKQANIEDITKKALPHLEKDSSPQDVEDDWIANFFDKSRIIADKDMQELWARVLADEANSPGAFSKKSVNLLADLDKSDAELFRSLCGFCWLIGNIVPLVYDLSNEIYKCNGVTFGTLSHLENLGFIQYTDIVGFMRSGLPKQGTVLYYGRPMVLTFPKDTDNVLELGKVLLTRAGQQLVSVCGAKPVDGFFDFVYDRWAGASLVPKREAGRDTPSAS